MNQLVIRPMKAAEAANVAALFRKIVSTLDYYNRDARTNEIKRYTVQNLKRKISEDKYSVLVASEDTELVGFCFSRWDDHTIWLEWFGVITTVRRKGIGRLILRALESTLHKRRAHKIWCDCRTTNLKSKKLLASSGYKMIGVVRKHWYRQDFILWHKFLG